MQPKLLALLLLLVLGSTQTLASEKVAFNHGKLDFSVKTLDIETRYSVLALYVMPGKKVRLGSESSLSIRAKKGFLEKQGDAWLWIAPDKPGLYPLIVSSGGQSMILNMFVLRPASEMTNGKLGDYQIGQYTKAPFRGLATYKAPQGFVEITADNKDTPVSPHFTLEQFLCKQKSSWPKYMALRPELAMKLENILERLNQIGIRTHSLVIMSGYRTPWYNRAIGNRTNSSRHLYGGAADIYIDEHPADGVMDDLNGDGKINKKDADILFDLFEKWSQESWWSKYTGGLAAYGANSAHGPFVHVDARGYQARWGR